MYSNSFSWITLLPHKRVTQRQDPHMGKCLDIQFYDIFLMGNGCFQTLAISVVTGAWSQFTGNCPFHWPNYYVFCLDFLVVTTSVHFGRAEADDSTCQTKIGGRAGWSELLTNLRAIWADGFTARINLKTQSKPVVWSDAYKCFFLFCLLYEMCYFALSLLKNTFLKKIRIMWMFTVNGWFYFFFLLLSEKIMTCGHFD